jgi:MoxR-like ATPase
VAPLATWVAVRTAVGRLTVHPSVAAHVLDVVDALRSRLGGRRPISTRAALQLLAVARAWAVLDGRDHVAPDDVRTVAAPVLAHRVVGAGEGELDQARRLVDEAVGSVPAPPVALRATRGGRS